MQNRQVIFAQPLSEKHAILFLYDNPSPLTELTTMKINILSTPRSDIFKNQGKYIFLYNLFLAAAVSGILLGVYAVIVNPANAETLGNIAMWILGCSSILFFIVGEKLRVRRPLSAQQEKELETLCSTHPEIQNFCQQVAAANRHITYAEFEACQDFAEEKKNVTSQ